MSGEMLLGDAPFNAENLESLAKRGELWRPFRQDKITQHFC